MKDTIYLICDRDKVARMVKTERAATSLHKNEIPIKLNIQIPDENWTPPYVEKDIVVDRWDKTIDIQDVNFEGQFVTEEEAKMIRDQRLERYKAVLKSQGYTITKSGEGSYD